MRHGFVPARDRGSVHVPSRHPPFLRATERTIADVTTHRALPPRIFVDFQNVFTVPHKNTVSAKLPAHHVALPARRVRSQRFLPALVTTHASVVVVQPSTLLVVPGDEELPLRFSIAQVRNLPLRVELQRVQKKIFARRARVIKGKCWREGTFARVCICTTLRTIYEG